MANDDEQAAERLRRQQDILAQFGLHAIRADDLDELLTRAAELVAEGLDVQRSKVLELLPDGKELLVRAGVNWNPGVVGHARLGADTDSPAGFALRESGPVVSSDVGTEDRFEIPELMVEHGIKSMVNVPIPGEKGPFGVLEVDATQKRDFTSHDISFLQNYANILAAAVERHRSQEALAQSARSQTILVQELEHRVKNMLGLVMALAHQTDADNPESRAFRDAFLGRLQALADAENLLFEDHARKIELKQLVKRSIEPFEAEEAGSVVVEGPSLKLPARSARMLALVLHELATNATKHGALSVPEGRVTLTWELKKGTDGRVMALQWREANGPEVRPPTRRGFGTKLLSRLAGYELDGHAELNYAAEGLGYEIEFPIPDE